MKNQSSQVDMRPSVIDLKVVFLEMLGPAPDCSQLETDNKKMKKRGKASMTPSSKVLVAFENLCSQLCFLQDCREGFH